MSILWYLSSSVVVISAMLTVHACDIKERQPIVFLGHYVGCWASICHPTAMAAQWVLWQLRWLPLLKSIFQIVLECLSATLRHLGHLSCS